YILFSKRSRVLMVYNGQILAQKGWISSGKWSLPGGGVFHHEKPEIGAVREVKEETGIEISPARLQALGAKISREAGLITRYYGFAIELNEKLIPTPHFPEIIECRWLDTEELNATNATNDLLQLLDAFQK
ncbi:MAG TPA: NUDIX hydrolase, partial [Patescibacteria group bacterium]|nr:NUDIX hydrolase [Patescibacteria group bacterium]